jgi:chemotaxis response regulator CheB
LIGSFWLGRNNEGRPGWRGRPFIFRERIAQRMPAIFTMLLAKRLATKCALPVRECQSGDLLGPSCVWIAPGDYHMVVQQDEKRM